MHNFEVYCHDDFISCSFDCYRRWSDHVTYMKKVQGWAFIEIANGNLSFFCVVGLRHLSLHQWAKGQHKLWFSFLEHYRVFSVLTGWGTFFEFHRFLFYWMDMMEQSLNLISFYFTGRNSLWIISGFILLDLTVFDFYRFLFYWMEQSLNNIGFYFNGLNNLWFLLGFILMDWTVFDLSFFILLDGTVFDFYRFLFYRTEQSLNYIGFYFNGLNNLLFLSAFILPDWTVFYFYRLLFYWISTVFELYRLLFYWNEQSLNVTGFYFTGRNSLWNLSV